MKEFRDAIAAYRQYTARVTARRADHAVAVKIRSVTVLGHDHGMEGAARVP
jgi:hypothetical protein